MARKFERHGFDIPACANRIRAELVSRAVRLEHDDRNPLAVAFAQRALERYGAGHKIENVCSHPFCAHIAVVHGAARRVKPEPGCKDCALLYVLWLPYKLERSRGDQRTLQIAEACSRALPALRRVREILAALPSAGEDVELLALVEECLERYESLHEDAADPEVKQAFRPGRRSNDLLRDIERALRSAGYSDREVARFVFGSASRQAVQSIRDRRRSRTAAAPEALEK